MKVGKPKIERLYKMEFDRAMGNDSEQKQMEKAFTYGMALNRQGLKPIKSIREVMREHFELMEHRRLLYTLRFRKGNSVCGEREPCIIRKLKQQQGGGLRSSQNRMKSSRRSLSIYSERPLNNAGEDDKRFEWKYRVKDRDHIPDFFL